MVLPPFFFGRPFKRNSCLFFSAVFFDQTVGMAVACSNQGESNWFRDHRSMAEKPRCQVAWTGERWVDEWMSEIFMAFFPWWTTETPSCLQTYIDDEGVDYRDSTCHPITSSEDFGDTEIHTPINILEYVWIPQYPWISLNLNSQITFLGGWSKFYYSKHLRYGSIWNIDVLYQVDCGQVRRGTKDPCAPGFLSVGVSKNRGNLGQSLSPFLLFTPKVPKRRRKVFMKLTCSSPEAFYSWVLWKMFKGKDPFEWTC